MIALIVVAVLLGGGGTTGVLYMLGLLGTGDKPGRQVAVVALGAPVLVDFFEAMVDLKVGGCRSPYLRYAMTIEVPSGSDAAAVGDAQARIVDTIQQNLRSKERQELVGVEGADRMRNEAREIVNRLIAPARINGVLFKKFVLQ
ncbi:MAG: flagellar basal body-associated FliL family protein [Rhodospirillales bacterium]|nr:flagellar basal body-associated FliL family protein [Rhodospirillales bacterium]MSP80347.1 flagellar basal body-associated FliL family protein [Rhodospirillales bacterium]